MAFNTTYNFDAQTGGNNADWTFSDPLGTGLQASNTARRWSWEDAETTSSDRGPINGQGNSGGVDGYVYTEMSSPGANGDIFRMELASALNASTQSIEMDWWYSARTGDVASDASIQIEAWNGSTWDEVRDTGNIADTDAVWVNLSDDFDSYTNTDFKIAIIVTQGAGGTAWHKDIGFDTINIVGVDRITNPDITDFGDEDHFNDDTNITLTGTDFENSQGSGEVTFTAESTWAGSTTKITQSIDTWSDTSIQFDVVKGTLSAGTLYAYVTNGSGDTNADGYSFTLSLHDITITDFGDEDHLNTDNNIVLDGTYFGATQGTSTVIFAEESTYAAVTGTSVQSIDTWSNTSIQLDITKGSLDYGTLYVYVTRDLANTNANGYAFTLTELYVTPTISTVSTESNYEGSGPNTHVVTLSHATQGSEDYSYSKTNIDTSDTDFSSITFSNGVTESGGTLTVPDAVSSFDVVVNFDDESDIEPDEDYTITIGGTSGTGTIFDDDDVTFTYLETIENLGADHIWELETDSTDSISTLNGTDTSIDYTAGQLCTGATNSAVTNADGDNIQCGTSADTSSATNDILYSGWYQSSTYQLPPVRIVGDGQDGISLSMLMGYGNNLVFEFNDSSDTLQIAGDTPLVPNRAYHLTLGITSSNELVGYLDGIKQTDTVDAQASGSMTARTNGFRFGGIQKDGTPQFYIGGQLLLLVSSKDGRYSRWASWNGSLPSDTQIREKLFALGAIPDETISNQAGLDTYADTVRGNHPLAFQITGSNLDLTADNVTFDPLCSLHIRWEGSGTLNWTNTNGSNAVTYVATKNGTVNIINPATLTIEGIIDGSEVRIYDNEISNYGNNDTELDGIETLSGTTFEYLHDGSVNDIVIQVMAVGYEEIKMEYTLSTLDETLTVFPETETN